MGKKVRGGIIDWNNVPGVDAKFFAPDASIERTAPEIDIVTRDSESGESVIAPLVSIITNASKDIDDSGQTQDSKSEIADKSEDASVQKISSNETHDSNFATDSKSANASKKKRLPVGSIGEGKYRRVKDGMLLKKYTFYLQEEIQHKLAIEAVMSRESVSEALSRIISEYVKTKSKIRKWLEETE